ncbi:MAG: hypothetical protein R2722_02075 [Tessaracoccus sp.]
MTRATTPSRRDLFIANRHSETLLWREICSYSRIAAIMGSNTLRVLREVLPE